MRIIVFGTRTFRDRDLLFRKLDRLTRNLRKKITVVSGGAPGADRLGEEWARARGHGVEVFPAEWGRLGRAAGIVRNQRMADSCWPKKDAAVAFWNGKSRGTRDMIRSAKSRGLQVRVLQYS